MDESLADERGVDLDREHNRVVFLDRRVCKERRKARQLAGCAHMTEMSVVSGP